MYNFMSRSLWWVTKGLAVAPPGIMFIMGVSTSMKFKLLRYFLTKANTFDLTMKVYRVLLFMIKSRYLLRYLFSLCLKPVWISGNMWRHGDSKKSYPGAMDNYPVFVRPGLPIIPTISPLLRVEYSSSKLLVPLWLFVLHITCNLAPSWIKSMNTKFLPAFLIVWILPATEVYSSTHFSF